MRGKACSTSFSARSIRDHPRLCGEKLPVLVYPLHVQGSPPPMRGKGPCQALRQHAHGITPAYAGKSGGTGGGRGLRWDHPRLCGEKRQQSQPLRQAWGSPPPMRGKVVFHMKFVQHHRITPAYAGKSFNTRFKPCIPRDHPRLCGEKFCNDQFGRSIQGSPPPMRGKAAFAVFKRFYF